MAVYIVLLGPPGAGKGTQAERISAALQIPHISTGDLFRENLKNETALGREAQKYMNAGQLVPDQLTIDMVKERLSRPDCKDGALMDGFPRTSAQAEAFDTMLTHEFHANVECVPCIDVVPEKLIERLSGRWMCPDGHVFHTVFKPASTEGVCDVCSKALYQRDDDKIETVKNRLDVYEKQTAPLIEYYRAKGVLALINGDNAIESVSADIMKAIRTMVPGVKA